MACRRVAWGIAVVMAALQSSAAFATESPDARAALDRLAAFMGGAQRLYAVRTLVVASDTQRDVGNRTVGVPTRTYFAFPLAVRQEIVVAGRTLAMAAAPGGGWALTEDGADPLPETARIGLERAALRNPVALVKARIGRGFEASHRGTERIDGQDVDLVAVRKYDVETILAIARDDGRLVETRYALDARAGATRALAVRHDDWREVPGGLRYPHRSVGREDGREAFAIAVRRVEVDVPLAEDLFTSPWPAHPAR